MAEGDAFTESNRTFEIEIPRDCDSEVVLKSLLAQISPSRFGVTCDDKKDDSEDVCTETSSEDCMNPLDRKMRAGENPKSIKKKHKEQAKKRKALAKECKKKAKEIIKDFKVKEKQRRLKEKQRMKKIKRYEKQKDKEEKKCRKERKKCEKNKEKVRRAKEKEKLRTLKDRMKMKCESLKYAKASDCENDEDETERSCLATSRAATRDAEEKRKQGNCC